MSNSVRKLPSSFIRTLGRIKKYLHRCKRYHGNNNYPGVQAQSLLIGEVCDLNVVYFNTFKK